MRKKVPLHFVSCSEVHQKDEFLMIPIYFPSHYEQIFQKQILTLVLLEVSSIQVKRY